MKADSLTQDGSLRDSLSMMQRRRAASLTTPQRRREGALQKKSHQDDSVGNSFTILMAAHHGYGTSLRDSTALVEELRNASTGHSALPFQAPQALGSVAVGCSPASWCEPHQPKILPGDSFDLVPSPLRRQQAFNVTSQGDAVVLTTFREARSRRRRCETVDRNIHLSCSDNRTTWSVFRAFQQLGSAE